MKSEKTMRNQGVYQRMMKDNKTIDYYDQNAQSFVENTINVDFKDFQDDFLSWLPKAGAILDFGCGSGRDTKYFLEKGYRVTAIDGSAVLCRMASEFTGIEVKQMMFDELNVRRPMTESGHVPPCFTSRQMS